MSPSFRSKLYPGLKRSGARISWADRHSRVGIAIVDFWTGEFSGIIVSEVWIGTRDVVSGCGGNLDSICSGLRLFTGVSNIGSEQRRALIWSWGRRITRPSGNFIKKVKSFNCSPPVLFLCLFLSRDDCSPPVPFLCFLSLTLTCNVNTLVCTILQRSNQRNTPPPQCIFYAGSWLTEICIWDETQGLQIALPTTLTLPFFLYFR